MTRSATPPVDSIDGDGRPERALPGPRAHPPSGACERLDQIEIYFSIVQRKVLTPNDSQSVDEIGQRVLDFRARYEASATPFEWKFTRRDLTRLLRPLDGTTALSLAA